MNYIKRVRINYIKRVRIKNTMNLVFQSGFQSGEAVPLNNEAFLAMMSSGTKGLTVEVNFLTR